MKADEKPTSPLAPGLYIVATPIGNLEDITLRALRVLKEADLIACEDTRHTQKLLNHYGITTRTISYHEHNEASRAEELVRELEKSVRIALVTDAGMPGISDPGYRVVAKAVEHGDGSGSGSGRFGICGGAGCEWVADGFIRVSRISSAEERTAAAGAGIN